MGKEYRAPLPERNEGAEDRKRSKIPHAIERALERYGLKLTFRELDEIALKCAEGYGRSAYIADGKEKHIVTYRGIRLTVIYVPEVSLSSPHGRLVTMLPPEAATNQDLYSKGRILRAKRIKPEISLKNFPKKITGKLRRSKDWQNQFTRQQRRGWDNYYGKK